ncbi:MAG: RNase adapter RapZ [Lapillicoccus sp.]
MSGAGRSTAANVLEDQGWYVVDNLPPQMLPQLLRLHDHYLQRTGHAEPVRVAAVVDVRSHGIFADFGAILGELRSAGHRPIVVFLDATDEALVRRFESVRRPHPLQDDGRLLDGILREREVLGELRSEADVIVDTSGLNVHQLSAKISSLFDSGRRAQIRLAVMSFGFKYGVPLDADFVHDMRFLPNPFWVPELRPLTGLDPAVSRFVLSRPGAQEFVDGVVSLMAPVVDGYVREGRRYVTLAVGCTGGKHRSVAVAEQLAARLESARVETFVVHRDLGRE